MSYDFNPIKQNFNLAVVTLLSAMIAGCGGSSASPLPPPPTNTITPLIQSSCSENNQQPLIYFSQVPSALPDGVQTSTVNALKPFWDVRYTNQVNPIVGDYANHLPYSDLDASSAIANPGILSEGDVTAWGTITSLSDPQGSNVQTACVDGQLVASAIVNGYDALSIDTFGGPAATWTYIFGKYHHELHSQPHPWNADGTGNLMLQGYFMRPYQSDPSQIGAEVNFGFFLTDPNIPGSLINYVISVARSAGVTNEGPTIGSDPTTGALWVSTLIKDGTQWVTKSPLSETTSAMTTKLATSESWSHFYRVNISYLDLERVLRATNDPAIQQSRPEDWTLLNALVQTEITGSMNQVVGSSVRGFAVYKTMAPL